MVASFFCALTAVTTSTAMDQHAFLFPTTKVQLSEAKNELYFNYFLF